MRLNNEKEGSDEYEEIRDICRTNCAYTAWYFHHWLIDKGYLIVRPKKGK